MTIYKCPECANKTEWTSNDDLIKQGWHWVVLNKEQRIVCDECFQERKTLNRDLTEIGSVKQFNRRGVMVDERSS